MTLTDARDQQHGVVSLCGALVQQVLRYLKRLGVGIIGIRLIIVVVFLVFILLPFLALTTAVSSMSCHLKRLIKAQVQLSLSTYPSPSSSPSSLPPARR
jgi:hypothetical protein